MLGPFGELGVNVLGKKYDLCRAADPLIVFRSNRWRNQPHHGGAVWRPDRHPPGSVRQWIVGDQFASELTHIEAQAAILIANKNNYALQAEETAHGSIIRAAALLLSSLDTPGERLTLRFSNADPPLELQSVWQARPGRGPLEHWLTIVNKSNGPITLGHHESLVLSSLAVPPGEADVWWINRGGGNAATEGGTFTQRFEPELDQILTSDPTNGSSPVPWFAIQIAKAQGLYVGWEFSGIGRIHIRGREVRVGNLPEFETDLPAGETFLVPPAFVGCYRGDIDDGSYSLHRFVLEKLLRPLPRGQLYPLWLTTSP